MAKIRFVGRLELMGGRGRSGRLGSWTKIVLPRGASGRLGSRARVPVAGSINGHRFRATAFPTGTGTHFIQINREMRQGAGVQAGDRAPVELEVDTKPRPVAVPSPLRRALAGSKVAGAAFRRLAPSHRKAIALYVTEAKRPETLARRLDQTLAALAAGTWRPR